MKKWPWLLYGSFLTVMVLTSLGELLYQDSALRTYYTILLSLNKHYTIYFTLNIMNILLYLLTPLVIFLYAFDIESPKKLWKMFFAVRIIFDLIGHHYDIQFIKSAYYQNPSYFIACIGVYVIPIIPSYIAHYSYAFKNKTKY